MRRLLKVYQKCLEEEPTPAEKRLKKALLHYRIKFTFQKRIKKYFFDFHIKGTKLLIEVDGGYHNSGHQETRDLQKEIVAQSKGYRLMRVKNREIWNDIDRVIHWIRFYSNKKRSGIPKSSLLTSPASQ